MHAEAPTTVTRPGMPSARSTGIPAPRRHCTVATLDPTRSPAAQAICRGYAQGPEYQGQRGLLLAGPPGRGKPSLAVAVLHQVVADSQGLAHVRLVPVPPALAHGCQRRHGPIRDHGLPPGLLLKGEPLCQSS